MARMRPFTSGRLIPCQYGYLVTSSKCASRPKAVSVYLNRHNWSISSLSCTFLFPHTSCHEMHAQQLDYKSCPWNAGTVFGSVNKALIVVGADWFFSDGAPSTVGCAPTEHLAS